MDQNIRSELLEEFNLRKQKDLRYSLRTFAKDLGMSAPFLTQILNGRRKISLERGFEISKKIYADKAKQSQFILIILKSNSESAELKNVIQDLMDSKSDKLYASASE